MTTPKALARLDALTWTLIYGGLFGIVLGIVAGGVHLLAGWSLGVLGAIAVVAGIVLIVVRSRLQESPPPGAQSSEPRRQGSP
jgi:F0F1-type ATP synthase assembly protein I